MRPQDSGADTLADKRHLVIRGQTASDILKVRAALLTAFRSVYARLELLEVTPPCMVQTSVELVPCLQMKNTAYVDLTEADQLFSNSITTGSQLTLHKALNFTWKPVCQL